MSRRTDHQPAFPEPGRIAPATAPSNAGPDPDDVYPLAPGSLIDARTCASGGMYPDYYHAGLDWLTQFVMRPHRDLGRAGAVCPFVAPALRRHLIWFGTVHTHTSETPEACEKARGLAEAFEHLAARYCGADPRLRASAALLAFFPDVPPYAAANFIDATHQQVRINFVARGLMLGEFHPLSTVGAVRNPRFRVMRSPMPIFTVRALSPHDLLFLDTPSTPPADRIRYLQHYL
jgi:hypothetical protein